VAQIDFQSIDRDLFRYCVSSIPDIYRAADAKYVQVCLRYGGYGIPLNCLDEEGQSKFKTGTDVYSQVTNTIPQFIKNHLLIPLAFSVPNLHALASFSGQSHQDKYLRFFLDSTSLF
jgi:hypothetical protein